MRRAKVLHIKETTFWTKELKKDSSKNNLKKEWDIERYQLISDGSVCIYRNQNEGWRLSQGLEWYNQIS